MGEPTCWFDERIDIIGDKFPILGDGAEDGPCVGDGSRLLPPLLPLVHFIDDDAFSSLQKESPKTRESRHHDNHSHAQANPIQKKYAEHRRQIARNLTSGGGSRCSGLGSGRFGHCRGWRTTIGTSASCPGCDGAIPTPWVSLREETRSLSRFPAGVPWDS